MVTWILEDVCKHYMFNFYDSDNVETENDAKISNITYITYI